MMEDFKTLPKMSTWVNYDSVVTPTSQLTLHQITPNHTIGFSNKEGQIGSLDFNGPAMKFEGNAEESALVFFSFVAKYFDQRLKDEYTRGYNDAKKENTWQP